MKVGIVGFEAFGRHGVLGVVVRVDEHERGAPRLVVRGGISDALVYHIPWESVRCVSPDARSVELDVDLSDFVPSLREDGAVELRFAPGDETRGEGQPPLNRF